jgi:exodeoxyribonuclease V alpha subunit
MEYTFTAKNIRALSHAYAITVHKSQGSQFKRVIVPMRPNRLLDQSLIYTAVTRSVEQVVFVGDRTAAVKAIKAQAAATRRHTGLAAALEAAAAKPEPLR